MLPEKFPLLYTVVDWAYRNFKARKLKGGLSTQYLTTALVTAYSGIATLAK
jgi:hypothetical protein